MAKITFLECSRCDEKLSADSWQTVCPRCAGSLYVRYDLEALKADFTPAKLAGRPASMWRYAEVLPDVSPVTLGEGFTPLLPSRVHPNVFIKDEALNPTGSFKARGLCMAVTMANHHGLKKLAIPSAGNAGGALAAYAAAAGLEAHIFMPADVPQANLIECRAYGAHVTLVDGLISDCAQLVKKGRDQQGWSDISTLQEPFRVEGKKTMGYEIAEQLNWELPDAILSPTGGGVGLIGMWKAFEEMETVRWVGSKRPKMIAVQAQGCAPIVKALVEGKALSERWEGAATLASGLRVPKSYADYLILDIVRQSGGTAIAVSDSDMIESVKTWAREEGIFAAPEGAATLSAYSKLLGTGFLKPTDKTVLLNTGSALKYLDVIAGYFDGAPVHPPKKKATRKIGGIIGPY